MYSLNKPKVDFIKKYLFQHPWAVVFLKNNGKEVHCSGALLSPNLVISASHCFTKEKAFPPNPSQEELLVVVGLDNITVIGTPLENVLDIQTRNVKDIEFFPTYDFPSAYDDIALVELSEPVTLGPKVWPICIPDSDDNDPDHLSSHGATVVGYGPKNEQSKVPFKHYVSKEFVWVG